MEKAVHDYYHCEGSFVTLLSPNHISELIHGLSWQGMPDVMKQWAVRATIDQLEDIEYILGVNERLGIRYNYPPQINLTH